MMLGQPNRLNILDFSDEILQVLFSFAPSHVCSSTSVCRRFAGALVGAKRVCIVIPKMSWGTDGSLGRQHRHQAVRIWKFASKQDQKVLLKLHDLVALVPLHRECSEMLSRVESLDLDACRDDEGEDGYWNNLGRLDQIAQDEVNALVARRRRETFGLDMWLGVVIVTLDACRNLRTLSLANNPLIRSETRCLHALQPHLSASLGSLTSLNLSYTYLDVEGAGLLAHVLGEAGRSGGGLLLQELDLRGNAMGAAGGTSLVPALQYATALRCDGCLFAFRRFSSSSASVRTSTHSGPSVDCVACVCALRHGRALHCAIALHHLSPTQNPKP
jgi:hypothetical protein